MLCRSEVICFAVIYYPHDAGTAAVPCGFLRVALCLGQMIPLEWDL